MRTIRQTPVYAWVGSPVPPPHAVFASSSRRRNRKPPSYSIHTMEAFKRGYKNTKSKLKGHLRQPSRQSVLTSPGRSRRSNQEPESFDNPDTSATAPTAKDVSKSTIALAPNTTSSPDSRGVDAPAHLPALHPEVTPAYTQPPASPSTLAIFGSVCNDLLTIVHSATDAFPPLQSALGAILEFWKQCEVRR